MTESPEVTGDYYCEQCGNRELFTGIDRHGYPGSDCDCGAYWGDPEAPEGCVCQADLVQDFDVMPDGSINYDSFTGGGDDAEISSYDLILCRQCGSTIWEAEPVRMADPPAPPAPFTILDKDTLGRGGLQ